MDVLILFLFALQIKFLTLQLFGQKLVGCTSLHKVITLNAIVLIL
jgi:hypothetical protein